MTDIKKDSGDKKTLREQNQRKNFDETRFMADMVLFFCERSLDEIRTAKRNEELTAVCNLYSMINLVELREFAGYNCDFGLLDEYRDTILKRTEDSLHMMGVQTSDTYQFNPYMVCTFTAACADMDDAELDRIGNSFTTEKEFKMTYISVLAMILVNAVYQFIFMALKAKAVILPAFLAAGWLQLILASVTVLGATAAIVCYFRRCIVSLATEWKVRRRLLRSTDKNSPDHMQIKC